MSPKFERPDAEWRKVLTPEQYHVLREGGTEPPFTGVYVDNEDEGVYRCAACRNPLFRSEVKYHSGTGWPSFYEPFGPDSLEESTDRSHRMTRTEIRCAACGSHVGHVFPDGPKPTGLRYCTNSTSLEFDPTDE